MGICTGQYESHRAIVKYVVRNARNEEEIQILRKIAAVCAPSSHGDKHDCRYVVQMLGLVPMPENADGVGIVMRYLNGGNLRDVVNTDPHFRQNINGNAFKYIRQVLRGIRFLHANGLIHCDVKPENIMLHAEGGETYAVLADLGATTSKGTIMRGHTPGFLMPTSNGVAIEVIDLFALVVSMYAIYEPGVFNQVAKGVPPGTIDACLRARYPIMSQFEAAFLGLDNPFKMNLASYTNSIGSSGWPPAMHVPYSPPSPVFAQQAMGPHYGFGRSPPPVMFNNNQWHV